MKVTLSLLVASGVLLASAAVAFCTDSQAENSVDYLRDIQPIFRTHCFSCHAGARQEAGLRLDSGARLLAGGDSGAVVVPKSPDESLLLSRVTAGMGERMPPEGEPLSAKEIETLRRWISQGAIVPQGGQAEAASDHWAFRTPQRPEVPRVVAREWPLNPIDRFVLSHLEQAGVAPSPRADPHTLLRRLSLDLTGLPPSAESLALLESGVSDWYERLIEQLLASPNFGEHWGKHWLDLARYADTDGWSGEKFRPDAWRYRDWVIEAVNQDLPFDEFTVLQLAGDLLPDAGIAE